MQIYYGSFNLYNCMLQGLKLVSFIEKKNRLTTEILIKIKYFFSLEKVIPVSLTTT